MSESYTHFLDHNQSQQHNSVAHYEFQGQKVWLKKATKRHSTWIYLPLRWTARILGLHMLVPVPNLGGNTAILCEINRIQELGRLGIRIPKILAARDDAFLMLDAAAQGAQVSQLEHALKHQVNTSAKLDLYARAIQALSDIHSKNTYLSEAFARNILVDDTYNFSFIDFETDPAQVLSLQDCQTRDWLCFIFSTARCFELNELNQAKTLLLSALESNPQAYQDICKVADKLKWILKLKPEKLGSDGVRLKKCIYLLTQMRART